MVMTDERKKKKKRDIIPLAIFFQEMDLPEEEKTKRENLAREIETAVLTYFVDLNEAKSSEDEEKHDTHYLLDALYETIMALLLAFLGLRVASAFLEDYLHGMIDEVGDVTERRYAEDPYWTSDDRATVIGENTANYTGNYGEWIQAIREGKTKKVWHGMLDDRERPTHIVSEDQTVDILEPFTVGGFLLMFPTDTSLGAPPSETANCRCVLEYK